MKPEEKIRLRSVALKIGAALSVGFAYWLFIRLTGWAIPCVFHLLTGLQCPGCGLTRMCLALLRLDFVAAARYNLLVLCLLPVGVGLGLHKTAGYVKTGEWKMSRGETVVYCVAFVLCIVFTVLRNTDLVPFLKMP